MSSKAEESNTVEWSELDETGKSVRLVGTQGTDAVELAWEFDESDNVVKIRMNGSPELMTACVLGNDPLID